MADQTRPATTHADLLDLRDERGIMQEGFHFLDEKRLMLAAECLKELTELEALEKKAVDQREGVKQALRRVVLEQGLSGAKTLTPVASLETDFHFLTQNFLGTSILSGDPGLLTNPAKGRAQSSETVHKCANAVFEWLQQLAHIAVLTHNLTDLVADYKRTERRARAIEDVLLPENEEQIRELEDRLEDTDQEEAIRVRLSQTQD